MKCLGLVDEAYVVVGSGWRGGHVGYSTETMSMDEGLLWPSRRWFCHCLRSMGFWNTKASRGFYPIYFKKSLMSKLLSSVIKCFCGSSLVGIMCVLRAWGGDFECSGCIGSRWVWFMVANWKSFVTYKGSEMRQGCSFYRSQVTFLCVEMSVVILCIEMSHMWKFYTIRIRVWNIFGSLS